MNPMALAGSEPTASLRRRPLALWLVAGAAAWITFAVLMGGMVAQSPWGGGFDLELLLTGGRRVAAGASPYEPAMLAGEPVAITSLFYSYPPLVAQALAPLAAVPSIVSLVALLVMAPLAAAGVTALVVRRMSSEASTRDAFLITLVLLPFWFPFTLALLFGNLDALFVALYGLVLLAVLDPRPSRPVVVAAGVGLALASLTKLHPAVLGAWLVARGLRESRRGERRIGVAGLELPRCWAVLGVATVTALAALAASLLAGGIGPWADYLTVLRASSNVDLLDPRNLGPAVQVALLLGLGQEALAPLQALVVAVALAVSAASALRVDDPLESLLWATFASLVVLPVTWFHHFAVLVPFVAAALARGWPAGPGTQRRLLWLTAAGFAVAALGFGTVATWLLVPITVIAARISRRAGLRPPPAPQAVAPTAPSAA